MFGALCGMLVEFWFYFGGFAVDLVFDCLRVCGWMLELVGYCVCS